MADEPEQKSDQRKVEEEIRAGRKFSASEAVARMAGPGAMKGGSPVSPVQQAETELGTWLRSNLADPSGALPRLLCRNLKGSRLLLDNLDRPLVALAAYCRKLLSSEPLLRELVREADAEWAHGMGERPFFEKEDCPPHPDDPYTIAGVKKVLEDALSRLGAPG
jgi:hypothetical protein